MVWQTFNAAAVEVRVQGVSAPPMSAKGVLVNPVLVLHDLVAQLDRREAPGHTEGTEGFVWVTGVEANPSTATLHANIRDHDLTRFDERKRLVLGAAERVRTLHP
ncbi:MAG: peptidase dimerization domain-containing protein, partial [Luteococcus japonicus]